VIGRFLLGNSHRRSIFGCSHVVSSALRRSFQDEALTLAEREVISRVLRALNRHDPIAKVACRPPSR